MRIVTLEPFLTETVCALGQEKALVGISSGSSLPEGMPDLPRVTVTFEGGRPELLLLEGNLSNEAINLKLLKTAAPDIVIGSIDQNLLDKQLRESISSQLSAAVGSPCHFYSYDPRTLDQLFVFFEEMGVATGAAAKGREIAQRFKAQLMDWADNFYNRTKDKKVSVLSSVDPFEEAGYWIPDIIRLCSAHSQIKSGIDGDYVVSWKDLLASAPDVIVVAPRRKSLKEALGTFKALEKLPQWDDIPAVKRGEVIFADGQQGLYQATPHLLSSLSILVSAIAGLESGYITPRDSFFRLRWLELNRHKL